MYWWISSREVHICADYFYLILKCLLPPSVEMAGASERHLYNTNDTSSDTEDYTDDRRRRVFKSRVRYVKNCHISKIRTKIEQREKLNKPGFQYNCFSEGNYKFFSLVGYIFCEYCTMIY